MDARRWTTYGIVVWAMLASIHAREAAAQTCVAPPAGLAGWWAGNGSALDGVTGTAAQPVGDTSYVAAAVGQGFKFDGAGDFVRIADAAALKPARLSLEAWVRFDSLDTPGASLPGLQYVVFKRNTRVFNFEAYALRKERRGTSDRFVFSMADVNGFGNEAVSTTAIALGQLYHVVVSYDGATVKLYVSGVLEGQSSTAITLDYSTRPVVIGATDEAWEGKLNGVVDDASIYNRALTAGEVSSLFAASAAGKCAVMPNVAPVILKQPAGTTPQPGQTATLSVAATGTGPLNHQWYVGPSGTTTTPVAGATSASYTTPPMTSTTTYWVRVSNAFGDADSVAATVSPLPTVGVPTGLYVKSANGNTVTFAWTPSPGQMAVTGHVLEGGLPGGTTPLASIETGSAAPAFTLSVPNGSFWVRMRARAGSTLGEPSAEMPLCLNAGCPPASPTSLLGLANGSALSLGWRTPLEAGAPSRITLQVSGAVSANLDLPGTTESFAFAGVPAGTYTFALTSCTAAGCSAPSSPVTLSFPGACAGPPATPTGFSAGTSGSTLVLDWGLPATGSPPTSYVLAVSGAFTGSVSFATRGFTGAVPPGTYGFTLAAANACGVSVPTAPLTVTVP